MPNIDVCAIYSENDAWFSIYHFLDPHFFTCHEWDNEYLLFNSLRHTVDVWGFFFRKHILGIYIWRKEFCLKSPIIIARLVSMIICEGLHLWYFRYVMNLNLVRIWLTFILFLKYADIAGYSYHTAVYAAVIFWLVIEYMRDFLFLTIKSRQYQRTKNTSFSMQQIYECVLFKKNTTTDSPWFYTFSRWASNRKI